MKPQNFQRIWGKAKVAMDERRADMIEMFSSGKTLDQIGSHYGITRQRAQQILAKAGVTARESSAGARPHAVALRESRCIARWGVSRSVYLSIASHRGAINAYTAQRSKAKRRGIEFRLTLAQWWSVWQESGMWERRGRRGDSYVMGRYGDMGAYEAGNVKIFTASENGKEVAPNRRAKGLMK